jgi:hypothetical protein
MTAARSLPASAGGWSIGAPRFISCWSLQVDGKTTGGKEYPEAARASRDKAKTMWSRRWTTGGAFARAVLEQGGDGGNTGLIRKSGKPDTPFLRVFAASVGTLSLPIDRRDWSGGNYESNQVPIRADYSVVRNLS